MKFLRVIILIGVATVLSPAMASAGGHNHDGWAVAPAGDYQAAMPAAYPFAGGFGYPPGDPWGYAIPIQAVYQFPAVIANQPGSEVGWLRPDPAFGLLGGRPHLYHP
jgi:hypothetical protein